MIGALFVAAWQSQCITSALDAAGEFAVSNVHGRVGHLELRHSAVGDIHLRSTAVVRTVQ